MKSAAGALLEEERLTREHGGMKRRGQLVSWARWKEIGLPVREHCPCRAQAVGESASALGKLRPWSEQVAKSVAIKAARD